MLLGHVTNAQLASATWQSLPLKDQYGGPILFMPAVFQSAGSLCQPESRSERNSGRKPEEDDGEQT